MTWLLYSFSLLLCLGRLILKSFKVLKRIGHSKDDTSIISRDLLISWTVYLLLVGWEISTLELLVRWIPGYYYVKTLLLSVIVFPQTQVARIVFFEFVKPWTDHILDICEDLGLHSPTHALEIAPFLILSIIFPVITEKQVEEGRPRSVSDARTQVIKSKLSSTSKKLSILTEHLDELELRSSTRRKDDPRSNDSQSTESPTGSKEILTKLNIYDTSSMEQMSSDSGNKKDSDSITSPRHNRRRSLQVLQDILEKQASSTLQLFGIDRKNISHTDSGSRNESRTRSTRTIDAPRLQRRPSKDNLLLLDPNAISNVTTRQRRMRNLFSVVPIDTNKPTIFRGSMPNYSDMHRTIEKEQPRPNMNLRSRESVSKEFDVIFKGFRRPSTKVSPMHNI